MKSNRLVKMTSYLLSSQLGPLVYLYTIKNEFFWWLTAHLSSSFQKYIMGGKKYITLVSNINLEKRQRGRRQRVFGKRN
jgi:hypothetical protein